NLVRPAVESLEDRVLLSSSDASSPFVGNLYAMLLGRVPQAAEVDYWRGAMAGGMSETAVVQDFVDSAEYEGLLVKQMYQALLGRQPEPEGMAYWEAQLARGHDPGT